MGLSQKDIDFIRERAVTPVYEPAQLTKRKEITSIQEIERDIIKNKKKGFDTIYVDEPNKEIKKLAEKQGINYIISRTLPISMTKEDYYWETARRGLDG